MLLAYLWNYERSSVHGDMYSRAVDVFMLVGVDCGGLRCHVSGEVGLFCGSATLSVGAWRCAAQTAATLLLPPGVHGLGCLGTPLNWA